MVSAIVKATPTLSIEQRGAARIIRVHRPEARNALDSSTLASIAEQATCAGSDRSVRVLIITGSDKVFVAGGDLKEFGALKGRTGGQAVARKGRAMIKALRAAGVPVVAAIDADAYGGGCELAAACDLRIASQNARFHWVQNALAVTTGWGATERLVSLVGEGTAARWLLAAQSVSAEQAHAHGFVDILSTTRSALDTAVEWSDSVSKIAEEITRLQLALLRGVHNPQRVRAARKEREAFASSWAHPAHEQAVKKFMDRAANGAKR